MNEQSLLTDIIYKGQGTLVYKPRSWSSLYGAVPVRKFQGFHQSPSDHSNLPGTARNVRGLSSEDPEYVQGEDPNMYHNSLHWICGHPAA